MIAAGIKGGQHKTIRHRDKVYVDGDIHTNTVESAFAPEARDNRQLA